MSPHRPRALVVDDDTGIRQLLELFLGSCGCMVVTAADAKTALLVSERESFDLAIVDWRMPGMNGLDLAATLHRASPPMPIVLVSGDIAQVDRRAASEAGIARLLTKPFHLTEIEECLELIAEAAVPREEAS